MLQLRVEGTQEAGKEGGAGAQRRGLAAQQQLQKVAPLGKALQGLAQQEGQEGKLELPCRQANGERGSDRSGYKFCALTWSGDGISNPS